jgi:hypothetical protein
LVLSVPLQHCWGLAHSSNEKCGVWWSVLRLRKMIEEDRR